MTLSSTGSFNASTLFDGKRLTLARELSGINKTQLARDLDKSTAAVSGWESGTKRPSPANVSMLALRLGVDPEFFIARNSFSSALLPAPHYRSLRSTTQAHRRQSQRFVEQVRETVLGLEQYVEFPSLNLPELPAELSSEPTMVPETAARELRRSWNLGTGPIPHLLRTVEENGIVVVFSTNQVATIDAFSIYVHPRPLVVLNPQKDDYYRQRFDLAHEIGHLVMHQDADPGNKLLERQADRFSAEFLTPADRIAELLPTRINSSAWIRLKELKEDWGVSIQSLLYRARTLGVLDDVAYRNAMITLTKRGWRRSEPGAKAIRELPSLLPAALELLESEGYESSILSTEFGVHLKVFEAATARGI